MSPIVGHPHSAIARSTSALSRSSTRAAPASPPAASPHTTGRPTRTARAPSAMALITFGAAAYSAVQQHFHATTDRVDDVRQRADRRDRGVELTAAVVRHDDAGHSVVDRAGGVVASYDALEEDRELRDRAQPIHVTPGQAGIDSAGEVVPRGRTRLDPRALGTLPDDGTFARRTPGGR